MKLVCLIFVNLLVINQLRIANGLFQFVFPMLKNNLNQSKEKLKGLQVDYTPRNFREFWSMKKNSHYIGKRHNKIKKLHICNNEFNQFLRLVQGCKNIYKIF